MTVEHRPARPIPLECPVDASDRQRFGSDVVAEALRATGIPFIALTPGASFRGLHDSLVNHLGNRQPQMLVCLHEEHAVALAHGYAKVTGRPLAVALHANVGLMHATMAIFNAWCDRAPVLIIGATGPVDAAKRRPWIDWIHTARDQGALIRGFVKWDDQPASPTAARESLWRAHWLSTCAPCGPTYVCLDAEMQEKPLTEPVAMAQAPRFMPTVTYRVAEEDVDAVHALLAASTRPVLLFGRGSRSEQAWDARVRLAESFKATVLSDLKLGAVFPTDHPLHAGPPGAFLPPRGAAAIRAADLVISFDWTDLEGTLRSAWEDRRPEQRPEQHVVHVSIDHHVHNGWSMDHQALPAVDRHVAADPDLLALRLAARTAGRTSAVPASPTPGAARQPVAEDAGATIDAVTVARALREACADRATTLLHLPISWDVDAWPLRHPLDYVGGDGGAGIGSGLGLSIGGSLALRDGGRLPICITGDGDFVMGVNALWTATHYRLRLLVVVMNNKSFFNDEVHQERVARARNRPTDNRWIGQRLDEPELGIVQLAEAQGARGFGPVCDATSLPQVLRDAVAQVDDGRVAVVDVRVARAYLASVSDPMTKGANPDE